MLTVTVVYIRSVREERWVECSDEVSGICSALLDLSFYFVPNMHWNVVKCGLICEQVVGSPGYSSGLNIQITNLLRTVKVAYCCRQVGGMPS